MLKTILVIGAGLVALFIFRRGQAKPAVTPPLRTNADASYSLYGNHAPSSITAASNASASGIGTSDFYTYGAGPYVSKQSTGFMYPNKPMVDDRNAAAGYETMPYVDPFHDESSN